MKIAVFIDQNHVVQSFINGKYLAMFIKENNKWEIEKLIELEDCRTFGMGDMRNYFNSIIELIPDTRVVVGKEAYGIPYNVFYSKDFSIWEMEGDPYSFLEQIMIREIENEEESNKEENSNGPIIKISEGKYYIDLIELQNSNGITSKQAIIPFLQKENFNILEIKCCHIPPWLNREKSKLGFCMEIQEEDKDIYKVILNKF